MATTLSMKNTQDSYWLSLNQGFPSTTPSSNIILATAPKSRWVSPLFWTPVLLIAWISLVLFLKFRFVIRQWVGWGKHALFRPSYQRLKQYENNENSVDLCSIELGVRQNTPPLKQDRGFSYSERTSGDHKAQVLTRPYDSSEPCLMAEFEVELDHALPNISDPLTTQIIPVKETLPVPVSRSHTYIAQRSTHKWSYEARSIILEAELTKYFPFSDAVDELNAVQALNPLRRKANMIRVLRQMDSPRTLQSIRPIATQLRTRNVGERPKSKLGPSPDQNGYIHGLSCLLPLVSGHANERATTLRRAASCPSLITGNNRSSWTDSNVSTSDVEFATDAANTRNRQQGRTKSREMLSGILKHNSWASETLRRSPRMRQHDDRDLPQCSLSKRWTWSGILEPVAQLEEEHQIRESNPSLKVFECSNSAANCFENAQKYDTEAANHYVDVNGYSRLNGQDSHLLKTRTSSPESTVTTIGMGSSEFALRGNTASDVVEIRIARHVENIVN